MERFYQAYLTACGEPHRALMRALVQYGVDLDKGTYLSVLAHKVKGVFLKCLPSSAYQESEDFVESVVVRLGGKKAAAGVQQQCGPLPGTAAGVGLASVSTSARDGEEW